MKHYNKNIAALIITTCIICLFIALFTPKSKNLIAQESSHKKQLVSFSPIHVSSPFREERISVIRIEGVIKDSVNNSIFKETTSSVNALDLIIKATKDNDVKAIVIRVNSPGGTVAASQELYKAILNAKKKKPVIITMGDIAASGGYYIASAADAIFANPGTLTGSIGVITSYLNFTDLLTMVGVKGIVIKSGKYKDIGNPTKPLTEAERKILQALLDDTYNQFIHDVSKGRNIPVETVQELAQGLIYTGRQAKKNDLVDYLGDYYLALKYAQKIAKKTFPTLRKKYGSRDLPVEETWKEGSILDVFLGAKSKQSIGNVLANTVTRPYIYSKFQPLWLLE